MTTVEIIRVGDRFVVRDGHKTYGTYRSWDVAYRRAQQIYWSRGRSK